MLHSSFRVLVLTSSTGDLRVRGRYFGKTRVLANRDGDTESQGSGEGYVTRNLRSSVLFSY